MDLEKLIRQFEERRPVESLVEDNIINLLEPLPVDKDNHLNEDRSLRGT